MWLDLGVMCRTDPTCLVSLSQICNHVWISEYHRFPFIKSKEIV